MIRPESEEEGLRADDGTETGDVPARSDQQSRRIHPTEALSLATAETETFT